MTQESVITQQMRDAIGVESEPATYDVERGAILKFAQAIGDTNPLFNDEAAARKTRYGGLIAPPTFLRSMSAGPMKADVKSPYPAALDGGSEWEYFEPVRPGDRITVTLKIADMFERPGRLGNMLFIIRETKYVNQFGQTVALQRGTGISYKP
jgi:acyl dehydratase